MARSGGKLSPQIRKKILKKSHNRVRFCHIYPVQIPLQSSMAPRPLDLMKGSSSFTRIFPRPQNWTQAVDQATGRRAYYVKPAGFHLLPFVTFGHLFILAPCSISVFFGSCFQTAGESLFTSSYIPCLIARRGLVYTWRGTLGGENQVACCKKWHSWTSRGQSSLGTEHKTNYDYLLIPQYNWQNKPPSLGWCVPAYSVAIWLLCIHQVGVA